MKKQLILIAAMLVAHLGSPLTAMAGENDPFEWTQRCFAGSKDQLDWAGKRQECVAVILGYCRFVSDSPSCFKNLTRNYVDRSKDVMASLPDSLDAPPPQKQFFENRLDMLKTTNSVTHCESSDAGTECAAFVSMSRYLGAVSLVEWLEKRKENQ